MIAMVFLLMKEQPLKFTSCYSDSTVMRKYKIWQCSLICHFHTYLQNQIASPTAVCWNSKTPGKISKSFATSDSIFTAREHFPSQSEIHMGEEGHSE